MKTLAVIPARGGSKRIQRKNVRFLAGKPLIYYAIHNAAQSTWVNDIVVTTEDPEIAYYAQFYGAKVRQRPEILCQDETTLDSVIHDALTYMEGQQQSYDYVVTLQPTSPMLMSQTIDQAIQKCIDESLDTVLSLTDDTHLMWSKVGDELKPLYKERLNSQYLPRAFKETGGVFVSKRNIVTEFSRFGSRVGAIEVPPEEAIDVDTYFDWWLAEKQLRRKKILVRVDGDNDIGLGHIYRCLHLANSTVDHEFLFVTQEHCLPGIEKIQKSMHAYKLISNDQDLARIIHAYRPEILINDILDTDVEYMQEIQKHDLFVVNFEDMGPGAQKANLVINDLYAHDQPSENAYFGPSYYCLRNELTLYSRKTTVSKVKNILVTFGGSDPANLSSRILSYLKPYTSKFEIKVILGLGYKAKKALEAELKGSDIEMLQDVINMGHHINQADLVITSAGRTVYEVVSLATPLIAIAQNDRETKHAFITGQREITYLGHQKNVSEKDFLDAFEKIITDNKYRQSCIDGMRMHDFSRGSRNVFELINKGYETYEHTVE